MGVSNRNSKKKTQTLAKNPNHNFEFAYNRARAPKLLDHLNYHFNNSHFSENHEFYNKTKVELDKIKRAGLPLSFYPRPNKFTEPYKLSVEVPQGLESQLKKTWKDLKMSDE